MAAGVGPVKDVKRRRRRVAMVAVLGWVWAVGGALVVEKKSEGREGYMIEMAITMTNTRVRIWRKQGLDGC
jgi:hypothetical protein